MDLMEKPESPEATIMIVDDEPSIRNILRKVAERGIKAQTIEAQDGHEALELFTERRPDVVISDIRMPGMDGVSLLKQLKALDPLVSVILVTGYPSLELAIQGMKEGASDFLTKPFRLEHVQIVLEKSLRQRQLLRDYQDLKEEIQRKRAIEQLNEKLHRRVEEMSALYSFGETIASFPLNRDAILHALINVGKEVTHASTIAFLAPDDSSSRLRIMMQSPDSDGVPRWDCVPPEDVDLLDKALQLRKPLIHFRTGDLSNPSSSSNTTSSNGHSQIAVPLLIKQEVFGVLHAVGKIQGTNFDQQDLLFLSELAKRASMGLENNYLYQSIFDVFMSTLRSLVSTIEFRDPYTKEHSQRVTDFSMIIAEELGCNEEQIDTLRVAGFLHDLGKVGVRDSVLLKAGPLTDEEFEQIKAHPVIGENIVRPLGFLPVEKALIRHHHERWDGKGYPDGLTGEEIPFLARVLTLADSFDAMTSSRPYRPAMSPEDVYKEIIRCGGSQFDAAVVGVFPSSFERWVEQRNENRAEGESKSEIFDADSVVPKER
jgi:response regulator RpfG family c-di-GMP phosphodiesterase